MNNKDWNRIPSEIKHLAVFEAYLQTERIEMVTDKDGHVYVVFNWGRSRQGGTFWEEIYYSYSLEQIKEILRHRNIDGEYGRQVDDGSINYDMFDNHVVEGIVYDEYISGGNTFHTQRYDSHISIRVDKGFERYDKENLHLADKGSGIVIFEDKNGIHNIVIDNIQEMYNGEIPIETYANPASSIEEVDWQDDLGRNTKIRMFTDKDGNTYPLDTIETYEGIKIRGDEHKIYVVNGCVIGGEKEIGESDWFSKDLKVEVWEKGPSMHMSEIRKQILKLG